MATVHLPIRQLVEFLLRTGSIDSRFTGFDRALEGAHIHRKLQKAAGDVNFDGKINIIDAQKIALYLADASSVF